MLEIDFSRSVSAKLPRLPIEIGTHDLGLSRQPPAIGEHTGKILAEVGLKPTEIEALRKRRIIAAPAADKLETNP
jgi:crotonobetainyl-CoA:carnitine CoA-transferase CaiB-like acyl-CoA transferase